MSPFGYTVLGFGGGKNQTYTAVSQDIPTGTETEFAAHYAAAPNSDWISADKFIAIWSADDDSPAYVGRSIVGSVSGTSISFGSMAHYSSNRAYQMAVASDPFNDDKFVVIFEDNSDAGHGHAVVGTVSGTTPSYGTEVEFDDSGACRDINIDFDPNTENKFVINTKGGLNSTSTGCATVGTISGTSISFATPIELTSTNNNEQCVKFNPSAANAGKFVVTYGEAESGYHGKARLGQIASQTPDP